MSFDLHKTYAQGNRIYTSNGVGCSILSNGGGLGGTGGGLYLTEL